MKIKNIVIAIIISIVILTGIIIVINSMKNTSDKNNDLQKIMVSEVTRSVFYAPQYVAIANGYFAQIYIFTKVSLVIMNWCTPGRFAYIFIP